MQHLAVLVGLEQHIQARIHTHAHAHAHIHLHPYTYTYLAVWMGIGAAHYISFVLKYLHPAKLFAQVI